MQPRPLHRGLWIGVTVALLAGIYWLDQNRGGPASMLSRCNFMLSKAVTPAADVLIVGSSRSGVALDPLAIQEMLSPAAAENNPVVERLALGNNPLRMNHALLENYLEHRGAPQALVLEVTFMTQRSVDKLATRNLAVAPEQYIFRRDINLLSFKQLFTLPAIAMPFSEQESSINLWRYRLRGIVLRAGALVYQFLRRPGENWQAGSCEQSDWTREPEWPQDFAFTYNSFEPDPGVNTTITRLEAEMSAAAPTRAPQEWQTATGEPTAYPYDFDQPYRAGEVKLLHSMAQMAAEHNVPLMLVPLPLYGYSVDSEELQRFAGTLAGNTQIFDVYGQVNGELDKFWYDDGHVESYPAGALTSALMARHLRNTGLIPSTAEGGAHD